MTVVCSDSRRGYGKRLLSLVLLVLLVCGVAAQAMSLQEASNKLESAKASGLVGEIGDGYLGVVRNEGEAQALVDTINKARREKYEQIAAQNGLQLSQVEAMAGQKAVAKTEPGQFIRAGGQWQKKPGG